MAELRPGNGGAEILDMLVTQNLTPVPQAEAQIKAEVA